MDKKTKMQKRCRVLDRFGRYCVFDVKNIINIVPAHAYKPGDYDDDQILTAIVYEQCHHEEYAIVIGKCEEWQKKFNFETEDVAVEL